jgi:hypothetical protein
MDSKATIEPRPVADLSRLPLERDNLPRRQRYSSRPGDVAFHGAASLVLLWAIAQNLFKLSTARALIDESTYATAAWRYVHGLVGPVASGPVDVNADNFQHPPFAKLLFGVAQLVAGHESITADRYVAALFTLGTSIALAVWIGHAAGRWTGLLAGAMSALLPQGVSDVRFGRFGMLDPVAEFFMVLSVALSWWWFHSQGRRAWLLSAATGAVAGLAAAAKENGFLGVVGPVLIGLALTSRQRDARPARLGQIALALVSCGGMFFLSYLPFDDRLARMKFLVVFQGTHATDGHLIGFAGRVSQYPPWWTNFWFAGHGLGLVLTYTLLFAALAAVALRHDRLVCWCLAALAIPIDFHCFVAKVVLPFYWVMWLPAFLALAALGVDALFRSARRLSTRMPLGPLLASAVLTIILASGASEAWQVARLQPAGPQVLAHLLSVHGLDGDVVAAGVYQEEFAPYTAAVRISYTMPATTSSVDAVVIGQPRCRTLTSPDVKALVTVNRNLGRLQQIYADKVMIVYRATKPLIAPSASDVSHESVGNLADQC